MINKRIIRSLVWVLCLLTVSCKDKEVEFTFSPETPRAGESVSFTNQTSEGEKWEWSFGDGTSSSSKNPSKIYKRSGTYTVILTVDGKNSRRCSHSVTVIDTVPQITLAEDSLVYFMTPTKLQMSAYNPYNHQTTYHWMLNDDVELLEGSVEDEIITVIFKRFSTDVHVNCQLTIGDTRYDCEQSFFVNDTATTSLMIVHKSGNLAFMRVFPYDVEAGGTEALKQAVVSARSIAVKDDETFLFQADQSINGAIHAYNMHTHAMRRVVYNAAAGPAQGFYNGIIHDGMLYWTGKNDGIIYRVSTIVNERSFTAGTASSLHWADISQLGYNLTAGTDVTGLAFFNDICFLSLGKGIYRFTEADLNTGVEPEAGAILTNTDISRFTIDPIAKKIYFCSQNAIYVCNVNGANVVKLNDKDCLSLCVDNANNRLYMLQSDGIWYMPLIQSANNATPEQPVFLEKDPSPCTMALDPTPHLYSYYCGNEVSF